MKTKIIYYTILAILILGIIGAGSLVVEELKTQDGCPNIFQIPVCIVILVCFLVPLVAHLAGKWNLLYFIFTGLAGIIALVASIMQVTGNAECPKTFNGTPMCYYSLLLFSSLIVLKIIYIQSAKRGIR